MTKQTLRTPSGVTPAAGEARPHRDIEARDVNGSLIRLITRAKADELSAAGGRVEVSLRNGRRFIRIVNSAASERKIISRIEEMQTFTELLRLATKHEDFFTLRNLVEQEYRRANARFLNLGRPKRGTLSSAEFQKFLRVMSKVPAVEPPEHDRL